MAQRVLVRTDSEIGLIRPELHGQFAEHVGSGIYGGLWVGQHSSIPNDSGYRLQAIQYLRDLSVPVLRWPGGCFADDYHWRDGIGPRAKRPRRVNLHWGNQIESNHFGTHEFIGLCRRIGAEPYIVGNVGSGSPEELQNWMEYCNYPSQSTLADMRAENGSAEPFRVRYWGVGNENWGCGGRMTPRVYADLFRRFAVYMPAFSAEPYLIASGPDRNDISWSQGVMGRLRPPHRAFGFAMHYYAEGDCSSRNYTPEAAAAQFSTFNEIEKAVVQQHALLNGYDPKGNAQLVMDEWGVHDRLVPSEEQRYGRLWQFATMRSAVAVGLGLNLFNRQADKLFMCNLAQMVNVRASLLETDGPEGAHCIRTAVYYVYALFKSHRSNQALSVEAGDTASPSLSVSASRREHQVVLSFINARYDRDIEVECFLQSGRALAGNCSILHNIDLNAYNSFDQPERIVPTQHAIEVAGSRIRIDVPRLSVITATIQLG